MSEESAKALASEYGVPYIDTSAKDNHNVDEAFMQLATSIKNVTENESATGDAAAPTAGTPGNAASEIQPLVLTSRSTADASSSGCC